MKRLLTVIAVWIALLGTTGCAPKLKVSDEELLHARLDGIEAQQRMLIEHQQDQMEAMDDLRKQMLAMQKQLGEIEGQQQDMQNKLAARPAPKAEKAAPRAARPERQRASKPKVVVSRPTVVKTVSKPAPKMSKAQQAKADAAFEHAYQTLKGGDFKAASKAFAGFMATYPQSRHVPEARYWLGETLFTQGDFARAADALRPFTSMPVHTPKRSPSLLRLAASLKQLGKSAEAAREYNRVRLDYAGSMEAETARKELKAMGAPEEKPAAMPQPAEPPATAQAGPEGPTWSVNIVSVGSRAEALQELAKLKSLGIDADQVEVEVNGKRWIRLRTTGYSSHDAAESERRHMVELGYADAWIKSE